MAKILLVEDDTNLSEIYQARMEAEGYTVVSASDGEAALAVAAKEKPDLIISDVMMPKISGFEMLDILRNTAGLKNTPVIMLTALGQADDKTRADQLGADRYLVKSQVTLEDIVNAAHALLSDDGGKATAASAASDSPASTTPAVDSSATANTAIATDTAAPAATEPTPPIEPIEPVEPSPATIQPTVQPVAVATPPAEPAAQAVTVESTPAAPAADTTELEHQAEVSIQTPPANTVVGGPGATITPSATPAPHETAAPLDGAVIDDHAVNNAVGSLLNQPSSSPSNGSGAVVGQRVITPPSQPAQPSLDELLAKEELREANNNQPGNGPTTPPSGGIDPNTIAL